MGMYTEMVFRGNVKEDLPEEVKKTLTFMFAKDWREMDIKDFILDHDFFKTDRWSWMVHSAPAYFPMCAPSFIDFDKGEIFIHCTIKNYTGEYVEFVKWISPYMDADEGEFLGYTLYEEFQYKEGFEINHIFKEGTV